MNSTTDVFNSFLSKTKAKKNGDNWQGQCPGHEDKTASLSLSCASDGKILMNCFAGCSTEQIVSALGFSMTDLFPPKQQSTKPRQTIVATYDYKDRDGKLLFQAVRYEPKGFSQRQPDNSGGWSYNLKGVTRVLYRLPELLAADPQRSVFVVEGEKDADNLWQRGLVATTSPMGAGKWLTSYSADLQGREVIILPDNDASGYAHAEDVAAALQGIASAVKVIKLPGLPDKGDVSDWFKAGNDEQLLCEMAERAPLFKLPETGKPAEEKPKETQIVDAGNKRNFVVDMVREHTTLFHDSDMRTFASVRVNGHIETYPVNSSLFKVWLSGMYYRRTATAMKSDDEKDVLRTIDAIARYEGEEHETFLRLASNGDAVYLDLSDKDWRVVEVTAEGWRTMDAADAPVRFVRRQAMLPIPEPIQGGKLSELRDYMNTGDDETWTLLASWLVMTMHPAGPYPILSVTGEQGSAKTSLCKMLRSIVDPNRADLRAMPKDERDLMIAASNSWLLAYDNLSGLTQELSDSLCRVATGAGFATRTLHTDSDETIFSVKRPILTNGIIDATGFPDLLDRTVSVFLRAIPDTRRREERELWQGFNAAKPKILGSVLNAVSCALKNLEATQLTRRPRMADFARWACAAEQGMGFAQGAFWAAYDSNRSASNEMALDTPLATELREFMDLVTGNSWHGTASDLHKALNNFVMNKGELTAQKFGWPKSPNALSGKLRRIAPNLRAVGLEIDCGRTNGGSKIGIHKRK